MQEPTPRQLRMQSSVDDLMSLPHIQGMGKTALYKYVGKECGVNFYQARRWLTQGEVPQEKNLAKFEIFVVGEQERKSHPLDKVVQKPDGILRAINQLHLSLENNTAILARLAERLSADAEDDTRAQERYWNVIDRTVRAVLGEPRAVRKILETLKWEDLTK